MVDLLDLPGAPRGAEIADLGCGAGRVVRAALQAGFTGRVHAVDHTSELDDDLLAHPRVRSVLADLDRPLPLPDASVHRVTSVGMLEHLVDPVAHLLEIHRVLVPGGVVVLCHSDWDTVLFATGQLPGAKTGLDLDALTRRLVDRFVAAMPSWAERADGFMGRRLLGLAGESERRGARWESPVVDTWADPHRRFDADSLARKVATGVTMAAAADPELCRLVEPWLTGLEEAAGQDAFLFTVTDVAVRLRKAG